MLTSYGFSSQGYPTDEDADERYHHSNTMKVVENVRLNTKENECSIKQTSIMEMAEVQESQSQMFDQKTITEFWQSQSLP